MGRTATLCRTAKVASPPADVPRAKAGSTMRMRALVLIGLSLSMACGPVNNSTNFSSAPRSYNGTASVGDFLIITLDPSAHTMTYADLSNGDSGTIPYQ